jgi:hypothetical protein
MTNPDVAKKGSKLEGAGGFLYTKDAAASQGGARQPRGRPLVQILSFLPLARSARRAFGPITSVLRQPLSFSARPRIHGSHG